MPKNKLSVSRVPQRYDVSDIWTIKSEFSEPISASSFVKTSKQNRKLETRKPIDLKGAVADAYHMQFADEFNSSTERTHKQHGCHVPAKLIEVFITFQKILFDRLFIEGGGDEIRFKSHL